LSPTLTEMICQAQPFCSPQDGRALHHRPQWDWIRTFASGSQPREGLRAPGPILPGRPAVLECFFRGNPVIYCRLSTREGDVRIWASDLRAFPRDSRKAVAAALIGALNGKHRLMGRSPAGLGATRCGPAPASVWWCAVVRLRPWDVPPLLEKPCFPPAQGGLSKAIPCCSGLSPPLNCIS